jgi:hypothetical protein
MNEKYPLYITNPLHRCKFCNGREVIKIEQDGTTTTNLEKDENGDLRCINKKECNQNIREENTFYDFYLSKDNGVKIEKEGKTIFEVRKDE